MAFRPSNDFFLNGTRLRSRLPVTVPLRFLFTLRLRPHLVVLPRLAVNNLLYLLPAVVQTPTIYRVLHTKGVNPLELLEQLNLPMIASPPIFHRPATVRASGAEMGVFR